MGEKFFLALLSVMLVILLVFNSFGVAYNNNNFFGTILIVEEKLGETSEKLLDMKATVEEWISTGEDIVKPLLNSVDTLIGVMERLDEKLSVTDNAKVVVDGAADVFKNGSNWFDFTVHFLADRGVEFNSSWVDAYVLGLDCILTDSFYTDKGVLDYEKVYAYIDALIYGEENEYAYILQQMSKQNVHNSVPNVATDTVFISNVFVATVLTQVEFEESEFWFTTVDLDIPKTYFPQLSVKEKFFAYFTGVIPVFDSNMTMEYKDQTCKLSGFRFTRNADSTLSGGLFNSTVLNRIGGTDISVYLNLQFTYYDDVGRVRTFYVTLGDYMNEKCEKHFFANHILDKVDKVLTRSDSVN